MDSKINFSTLTMKRCRLFLGFIILSAMPALFQYIAVGKISLIGFPITYLTLYYNENTIFQRVHFNLFILLVDIAIYVVIYKVINKFTRKSR